MTFLAEYPAHMKECRVLRHQWKLGSYEADSENGVVWRYLDCIRCSTQRVDSFTKERVYSPYIRVNNRYRYVAGYQFRSSEYPGEDKPTIAGINDELLSKEFAE